MSSSASSQALKSPYTPIPLLDTDAARLCTHLHPAILLSVYYLSFPLLVSDPVSALTSLLLPLAALQVAYVVICLPPTGAHNVSAPATASKTGTASGTGSSNGKKGRKKELSLGHRIIPALISLTLTLTLGVPIFLTLYILHGAPLTTHIPHTLLLSTHTALLTALPLIYTRGIERGTWRQVISLNVPIDETFGAALGAILGAWLGAVPIPLDWDREWQRWPVTVVTGLYVGWAVGKTIGGLLLRGKVIDLRG